MAQEAAGSEDSGRRGLRASPGMKPGLVTSLVPDFMSLTAKDLQPSIQMDNYIDDYVSLSKYF